MTLAPRPAGAAKVHVAAGTRIEVRADAAPTPNDVVVRGTLRDDVGSPIASSHVAISFHGQDGNGPALALPWPKKCPGTARGAVDAHEPHVAPDEYVVDTDAQGSFCFETSLPVARAVMKLSYQGSPLYDATDAESPVDIARPAIVLSFDPEPTVVSLDRPIYSALLRVIAPGINKNGWRVKLSDEKNRPLGSADVDPDGLCRVDVATSDLAGPGLGELRASLEVGAAPLADAAHVVERHARMDLEVEVEDDRPGGVPEDGIVVALRVRSSRGPAASGSIEAKLGDRTVGAAVVRDGVARVAMTFASTRNTSATVSMRYLPDAPWWEPSPPLFVKLAIHPPSAWRRAPLFVLALAVAAWMLRESYLSRLRGRPAKTRAPVRQAEPRPIQVVRQRPADQGWTGRVFDAHETHALAGAQVSIVVKSFPGADGDRSIGARTVTDAAGHFELRPEPITGKAVIRIEAPLHATLEQALPPPSELSIPLIARRRKLLDRLVAWAAAEWGAWDGAREPTPEQVAGRAARRPARGTAGVDRAAAVETWARAVESTAFGPGAVDEQAERKVTSLEPPK